jgi:hypothetical protein
MTPTNSFEEMSSSIGSLSKPEIKRRLVTLKGRLNLDFTDSYLESIGLDKLRHILFAAMVTVAGKHS